MSELVQETGGNAFLEDLLGHYKAPDGDTYEISLPKGEVLKFRAFRTFGELSSHYREAAEFAKRLLVDGAYHASWADCLPDTPAAAMAAYTIHVLSVEPKFSQFDALRLLKAPTLVEFLMEQIDQHRMNYQTNPVDDAKKGSRATPSSGSDCEPPATFTEDTPTN